MGLTWLLNAIQETLGRTRPESDAAETGIFRFPSGYPLLKAALSFGVGLLLLGLAWSLKTPPIAIVLGAALGVWYVADGVRIALGLRAVVLDGGLVTVESASGRKASWPLSELVVLNAGSVMSVRIGPWTGPIWVRERSTGRLAFRVPRDLPAWEILIARIPSTD
jgi:hypothetical protein